ncbi:MAG: substrate-binding domain-containing protein [Nitrospira sp.]|nr:substrate-binding domain-containing protein [Nitrospira sp.]
MTTSGLLVSLLLSLTLFLSPSEAWSSLTGSLIIAGNGPEQTTIEAMARAFEKANPRAYVDILWDEDSEPLELVKTGRAHIAVTGTEDRELTATQIGWDGIGILVHFSNFTKEVTLQQVADIFSGKIKEWSDVGGPEARILLINRPADQTIRKAFESRLGIAGTIPQTATMIAADDMVVKTVVGTLPPQSAAAYISLSIGSSAVSQGVAVRLLRIDHVEPETPTVKDGRYGLRRPLLLLSTHDQNSLVDAFADFALSPVGQAIVGETYIPISSK